MAIPQSQRARVIAAAILVAFLLFTVLLVRRPQVTVPLAISSRLGSGRVLDRAQNRTLGFEKIFAITLPSRSDHRDALSLAAAFTELDIDLVDGVPGDSIKESTLPPDAAAAQHSKGIIGSWRAHLNALKAVVDQNLSSALIMEGDVDWDIRIKHQMKDFARASRMLVQPLKGSSDKFLDPTFPNAESGQTYKDFLIADGVVQEPGFSPYGDVNRWDVLWLGHCGAEFPAADGHGNVPLGRIVIPNDETVAEPQHLEPEWGSDEYKKKYDPHTRIVSRGRQNVCTLAYAVTQQGARKLLYELGLKSFSHNYDLMVRHVCDGVEGRPMATCLTVQPPLFEHHRPVGPLSHVSDLAEHSGYNNEAFTINIRWSTRTNFQKLANGQTDYIDTLRDGQPGMHKAD